MLGLVSFVLPGFGQYLQRRRHTAIAFALAALAVWVGPSLFLAFHFAVMDQLDVATRDEFIRTLRPLTYLARLIVHAVAAYDATHILLPLRRPARRGAPPAEPGRRRHAPAPPPHPPRRAAAHR
jgi:hypothetical protein